MNSTELYDLFRSDVLDMKTPYLWSEEEVWRYMNDSYRMYVRKTGGVPDKSSAITQISVVATQQQADVSPLILKFRQAKRASDRKYLTIVNETDLGLTSYVKNDLDYGNIRRLYDDLVPGDVDYMVIGAERDRTHGLVEWVKIPVVNDTILCSVLRLPLTVINGPDMEFDDVGEEHHEHFLMWMKHRAYGKQDAETFDRGKSEQFKTEFLGYCEDSRLEYERYKTKVRTVAYGGL